MYLNQFMKLNLFPRNDLSKPLISPLAITSLHLSYSASIFSICFSSKDTFLNWKKRPFFGSNICDQDDQDSTSKMWSEDHVYQKSRVYDIHSNLVNIKTVQTVLRKLRCHERTSCVVGLQVFQEGSYLANLLQHRVQKLLQGSLGLPRSSD